MIPRQPPGSSNEPTQDRSLPTAGGAPDSGAPADNSVKALPPAEEGRDAAQPGNPDGTEVELDRFEAYLRGPTAFTA